MRTQIQFFVPLLLLQLFAIQLHAQFTISYNGETSFYLDENCELVFNLGGSVPMVTPTTPGASILIDTLDVALTGYALGETIIGVEDLDVYFRYEDDQGNDSLYVFQISILDTIPPDLAMDTDSVYLSCINELPELSDYLVDDNCDVDGGVSLNYFPLQTLPDFNCDSTVIEATALVIAIDFNGNRDTLLQTVFMGQDTLAPTLSVPNDTIIACTDDLAALLDIGLLDTADNCDYITQMDSSTVIQAGACTNDFTLTRYWTLVDTCGNVAIDSQTILVKDELAPIFQTPADTTVDCSVDSSPASLGEPTAVFDNCSGILNLTYTDYLDTLSCAGDALASILNQYPSMEIDLIAHTDARGDKAYNQALSEQRAASAKQYLVKKGIAANRIQGIGKGESELRNECADGVDCSDEEHQFNRRTEVVIRKMKETSKLRFVQER